MSSSQVASKRKKKFTGGNASKRHRDRVNIEFNNLAKLLPFPENVISKLDKSSILRLAVSYIRAKSFFKDALALEEKNLERGYIPKRTGDLIYNGLLEETCLTELFLQKLPADFVVLGSNISPTLLFTDTSAERTRSLALDGFLIVITEDLKVLYVSDSVRDYLGYCQAGIIHESFLQFIHWADKKNIANALIFDGSKADEPNVRNGEHSNDKQNGKSDLQTDPINGFFDDSRCTSKIASRRFVCRMKCAFSCSSRFYTAFRPFRFSGHVRRSTIQEGKESRTLNTLIAFGTPSSTCKFDALDLVSDIIDESRIPSPDEIDQEGTSMKMIGLHIEPRLRPHIAPIPIPQSETETDGSRQTCQQHYPNTRRYGVGMHAADPSSYNNLFNQPSRMGSAFKMFNDCYPDGSSRFSTRWDPRSSSLSNSPISDASSPSGLKRASSDDLNADYYEIQSNVKNPRLEENFFRNAPNGYSSVQLDDIHSSARILMQLQETQKRLDGKRRALQDCESDCSSEDRGDLPDDSAANRAVCSNDVSPRMVSHHRQQIVTDYPKEKIEHKNGYHVNGYLRNARDGYARSVGPGNDADGLLVMNRSSHQGNVYSVQTYDNMPNGCRIRQNKQRSESVSARSTVSSGAVETVSRDNVSTSHLLSKTPSPINSIRSSVSPSRLSPPSLSPKKDSNRGFYISTILGLDDKPDEIVPTGRRNPNETEDTSSLSKASAECTKAATSFVPAQRCDVKLPRITNDASNLDDIKTSFAHILQGLTATITQSIDKTIDTIFKSSETKGSVRQTCNF
eukprot:gene12762-14072_t